MWPLRIKFVPQATPAGCVAACYAMLAGVDFWTMAEQFGEGPTSLYTHRNWLQDHGFNGYFSGIGFNRAVDRGGLDYQAPATLISTLYKHNNHVILLHDGWVYDPATEGPHLHYATFDQINWYLTVEGWRAPADPPVVRKRYR